MELCVFEALEEGVESGAASAGAAAAAAIVVVVVVVVVVAAVVVAEGASGDNCLALWLSSEVVGPS